MRAHSDVSRHRQGFSLLEMLTTVAIVGVLASIALAAMTSINQNTKDARDRRHAQQIAAICNAAQAAGVDFMTSNELKTVVQNVVTGGSPKDGPFVGKFFAVPSVTADEQAAAQKYLELKDGMLSYKP
jgi:prepilin-type N-terminal cleavage/methylation domain-containing protein